MTLSERMKMGLLLLVILSIPFAVHGAEFRAGDQLSIGADEPIASDLYAAGGNVTTVARVGGDLLTAGGTVLVNSTVTGDVLAAGGSVTILGNVGDDLRAVGGSITISGRIGGDLIVGGGQVNVTGAGVVGDILAGAGTLRIEAPVGGNITVAGGDVFLNARVQGNVRFAGETLRLGKSAVIEGDLTYTSPKEVRIEEGAIVRGKTSFDQAEDVRGIAQKGLLAFVTLAAIAKFLSIFVCALIVGLAFSKYSVTLVETATARPLYEIGRGLITLVMLPLFSLILFVTVIGVPLGLLGFIAFGAVIIFASFTAPIILGSLAYRIALKRPYLEVSWKTILLGVVLYTLVGMIPYLGPLAVLLLILLTIGAIVKIKLDIAKNWQ